MNLPSIFNFINSKMAAEWTATEIEFDNTSSVDIINAEEFVRFIIYVDAIDNYGLGKKTSKLLRGTIGAQIFVRHNTGAGRAAELFDLYKPIFDNLNVPGGIECQATELINRGQVMTGTTVADRNWFMLNALTVFQVGFD